MWKSLEQQAKQENQEQKFSAGADIKPFKIKQDKDFYFVLMLGKHEYCLTHTRIGAEQLAQEILANYNFEKQRNAKILTDSSGEYLSEDLELIKSYPSLRYLALRNPEEFAGLSNILAKYSIQEEARDNGNYMSTLNGENVSFKTLFSSDLMNVTGIHITDGVAFLNGALYLPYEKESFESISSPEALRLYVKALYVIDWKRDPIWKLKKNHRIKSEMARLKQLAEQGEVGELSEAIEEEIEALLHGAENRYRKQVLNEALAKLDKMVGNHRFKEDVKNLMKTQKADRKLVAAGIKTSQNSYHTLLLGPAGTGKTELARIYADILFGLGISKERKLTEASKETLVSAYIGGTEVNTKEITEKAIGGVLFVDEAYTLINGGSAKGNDYGKNALEIIMRSMENHRDDLVVIFAGYEKEMETLLDANQGLRSRFNKRFYFEHFSLGELVEILTSMITKQGFELEECTELLERVIKKDMKEDVLPGNARSLRKYAALLVDHHKLAIHNGEAANPILISAKTVKKLTEKQMTRSEETAKQMQERALEKLNGLIGLNELKKEIQTWANQVKIEKKREELGLVSEKPSLHMTFKGAPGTGKTTTAGIIGEILKSNGLLSRGHFKEVTRSDLVAGYQGHTADKVKALFKEMEGGILFIDEAYSLVQGDNDDFGKEAVNTMIAEMENRREDLVVILAGYSKEIDQLMEANPGFVSRIPNHFFFPDYTAPELYELFEVQLKANSLTLTNDAKRKMAEFIVEAKKADQVDGNGRWIRNQLEKLKKNQSNRLAKTEDFTLESLQTITVEDIQL